MRAAGLRRPSTELQAVCHSAWAVQRLAGYEQTELAASTALSQIWCSDLLRLELRTEVLRGCWCVRWRWYSGACGGWGPGGGQQAVGGWWWWCSGSDPVRVSVVAEKLGPLSRIATPVSALLPQASTRGCRQACFALITRKRFQDAATGLAKNLGRSRGAPDEQCTLGSREGSSWRHRNNKCIN